MKVGKHEKKLVKTTDMQIPDNLGNYMEILLDENKHRVVSLKLKGEVRARKLGTIAEGKLFVKRKRSKHLHRQSKSYGFNYKLIKEAKTFTEVVLTDEVGRYQIPSQVILDHGRVLYFKQEGFERQLFLPLAIIEKYKLIEQKELF